MRVKSLIINFLNIKWLNFDKLWVKVHSVSLSFRYPFCYPSTIPNCYRRLI